MLPAPRVNVQLLDAGSGTILPAQTVDEIKTFCGIHGEEFYIAVDIERTPTDDERVFTVLAKLDGNLIGYSFNVRGIEKQRRSKRGRMRKNGLYKKRMQNAMQKSWQRRCALCNHTTPHMTFMSDQTNRYQFIGLTHMATFTNAQHTRTISPIRFNKSDLTYGKQRWSIRLLHTKTIRRCLRKANGSIVV